MGPVLLSKASSSSGEVPPTSAFSSVVVDPPLELVRSLLPRNGICHFRLRRRPARPTTSSAARLQTNLGLKALEAPLPALRLRLSIWSAKLVAQKAMTVPVSRELAELDLDVPEIKEAAARGSGSSLKDL
mmetsp:Transcript_63999/g.113834  ORF Transcript_63999/g.113834 Transcript_63999/m.113834 type:complete len:130 (+) Transcript_63999:558-947(+)